jgi:hypothetical protein
MNVGRAWFVLLCVHVDCSPSPPPPATAAVTATATVRAISLGKRTHRREAACLRFFRQRSTPWSKPHAQTQRRHHRRGRPLRRKNCGPHGVSSAPRATTPCPFYSKSHHWPGADPRAPSAPRTQQHQPNPRPWPRWRQTPLLRPAIMELRPVRPIQITEKTKFLRMKNRRRMAIRRPRKLSELEMRTHPSPPRDPPRSLLLLPSPSLPT